GSRVGGLECRWSCLSAKILARCVCAFVVVAHACVLARGGCGPKSFFLIPALITHRQSNLAVGFLFLAILYDKYSRSEKNKGPRRGRPEAGKKSREGMG